jgi:Arc/MetJ-type ribon-helix-helix transcriptional regulator
MSCEIPPDVQRQIQDRLLTGRYDSEADVLREAMRALILHDEEVAAIRAGIEDMEAGRTRPFEEADAAIRRRFGFKDRP